MKDAIAKLHTPKYTQKTLVVSTAHYTKQTELALLDEGSDLRAILSVDPLEYGWLIYVSDDADYVKEQTGGGHAELARLIQLAHDNGFSHLNLDTDGAILPKELGFPMFDWEEESPEATLERLGIDD